MVIQETHSTPECEQIWANEWGGKALFSHGTSAARGIAIFTSIGIYQCIKNVTTDLDGRLVIVDLHENDQIITIVAIYAPNVDNPNFFRNIACLLRERSQNKVIIGDFNLVLNMEKDRLNTYNNNSKAKEEVENICDEFILRDIWRSRNEESLEFSWIKGGTRNIASRIDFALVSAGLDQCVEHVTYISSIKTDHRAIYLVIDISGTERGKGYWKFNTSLLQDSTFVQQMNRKLLDMKGAAHNDPKEKWEDMKRKIKKISSEYARQKSSEDRLVISALSEKVNEYEANLPLREDDHRLWLRSKAELEEKLLDRTKGLIFRSKVKWYELGEISSKYFFSLEKARYNAKTCYKLLDEHQGLITQPSEILQKQNQFYTELYSVDADVDFTIENNTNIKVPENIKMLQEEEIKEEEIICAIKGMSNNKTPGDDGIPVDFYKVFWKHLREDFCAMVKHCYEDKYIHESARHGILNLIPKPNKDTRIIKNLRPITLLNTDYKIIEKVIANKMLPALKHIIGKDQRGFMKDRRISVNIRKMLDIMQHANEEDLEAVVLSLDFVKCFDKCSFSILKGSLDFFDFGKIVKEWTEILYTDFYVRIQNNGYFSDKIEIQKGVHQGGCCSSVYFLVIAEILALSLRGNQQIQGITIGQIKNLLNQFADDMDIFSMCNEGSIKAIHNELENFRKQSGFTVSYEKTTLYRIGSLRHSDAQLYSIDDYVWSNKDIRC